MFSDNETHTASAAGHPAFTLPARPKSSIRTQRARVRRIRQRLRRDLRRKARQVSRDE